MGSISQAEATWTKCAEQLPAENVVVDTKIDDDKGCWNEGLLKRRGSLWHYPDDSMHVYYTPTHWRRSIVEPETERRTMGLPTTYKYECGGNCGTGSDNPDDFARCPECREEHQSADTPLLCHEVCLIEYAGRSLCVRHYSEPLSPRIKVVEGRLVLEEYASKELVCLRDQLKRTRECLRDGLALADVTKETNRRPDGATWWASVAGRLEAAILNALDASGGHEPADEHLVTPLAKEPTTSKE